MNPAYIEALAKALAPAIKAAVAAEATVARREVEAVRQECEGLRRQLTSMPVPANGKDADMSALRAYIEEQVKAIPSPKDGKDGKDGANGNDGSNGADGKSFTLQDVQPVLDEAVKSVRAESAAAVERILADGRAEREAMQKAVADLRQPEDGTSVTLADVQPILLKAVQDMQDNAAKALDAAIKAIPAPVDGEPGKSITADDIAPVLELQVAKWALEFERRGNDTVQRVLDKIVQPKDGLPGKDGRDGLGFDDLEVEYDGEKTITLKMQRGDVVKEANIVLPINIDKGIFSEGQKYTAGDSVTWGGSYWIAQRDTGAKPDTADSGWRLAVKKGRDGKDGRNGIDKTAPVALRD